MDDGPFAVQHDADTDDELVALSVVSTTLAALDDAARARVLAYITARHGKPKAPRTPKARR